MMPVFEGVLARRSDTASFEIELEAGVQYIIDLIGAPSTEGRLEDSRLDIWEGSDYLGTEYGYLGYPAEFILEPAATATYVFDVRSEYSSIGGFELAVFEDDLSNRPQGKEVRLLEGVDTSRGTINYDGDVDVFSFNAIAGLIYSIEAKGVDSGSGSLADPELRLKDFNGTTRLADNADAGPGADDRLVVDSNRAQTYYLDVRGFEGETGTYRATVSEGRGTSSDERINGTFYDDAVDARGGDDIVRGNEGDDVLEGGRGADRLVGGPGKDVFLFARAADSTSRNRDTIEQGPEGVAFGRPGPLDGDLIDLSGIDANRDLDGNQDFRFGLPEGVGRVWLEEKDRLTVVRANVDDDPRAEFVLAIADGEVRAAEYRADDFAL